MNYTTDIPIMGQVKSCDKCYGKGMTTEYSESPPLTVLCPLCLGYGHMIVAGVDRTRKNRLTALPAVFKPPKPPPEPPPPKKIILV